ncbi:hypothetical protein GCM10010174_54620 [Kutzneria viridogrisea]|uniref:Uncharacterized protein n=1 Tax=Kutzneria viridogrisea TaxID=47990 RepID=A0ABR6B807_9PSEU|nr:hypothetical protein [Kutzneria viridogrisea]
MDDNDRLLRLISWVGWAEPDQNRCGLRYGSETDQARLNEREKMAAHTMCAYYSGALRYRVRGDEGDALDREQLPDYALEFATGLSARATGLMGELVARSLELRADVQDLGRLWVEDVKSTAWRLVVANHPDRLSAPGIP